MAPPPQEDDFEQYKRPATPSSVAFSSPSGFDPTSVRDTAIREFGALGKSILGIPGGVYHAFADKPTEEERAEFKGDVEGPKRIGLGVHRMIGAPIETAAKWYGDVARGRIPNAYEQALSVAPEAMGIGASAPIVGKMAEEVPGAMGAARNRIAPNPNFRPSIERVSGGPAATPLGRIAELPPAEPAPMNIDLRPSVERIQPESGMLERRGVDPELQGWYRGPERRTTGAVAPENQGFDFRPAEDIGNKVRQETEANMGPIKRGGKALRQAESLRGGPTSEYIPAPATNFQTLDPRMAALLEQLRQEPVAGAAPAPGGRPLRLADEEIEPETDLEPALKRSVKEAQGKKKDLTQSEAGGISGALREIEQQFPVNPKNPGAATNPKEFALMNKGEPEGTFSVGENGGRLRLKGIQSLNPKSGAGSRILKALTDIADKHGVEMELTASPYGDEAVRLDSDQLKNWYSRHGFKPETGYDPARGYMIREPQ